MLRNICHIIFLLIIFLDFQNMLNATEEELKDTHPIRYSYTKEELMAIRDISSSEGIEELASLLFKHHKVKDLPIQVTSSRLQEILSLDLWEAICRQERDLTAFREYESIFTQE